MFSLLSALKFCPWVRPGILVIELVRSLVLPNPLCKEKYPSHRRQEIHRAMR